MVTWPGSSRRHSGQVVLDRDYRYLVREGARAHTLYRQSGNQLSFYGPYEVGDGYLTLTPGVHELRIVVGDALGNETILEGEVLVNSSPEIAWIRNGNAGAMRVRQSSGDSAGQTGRIPTPEGRVTDPDGDGITLSIEVLPLAE